MKGDDNTNAIEKKAEKESGEHHRTSLHLVVPSLMIIISKTTRFSASPPRAASKAHEKKKTRSLTPRRSTAKQRKKWREE